MIVPFEEAERAARSGRTAGFSGSRLAEAVLSTLRRAPSVNTVTEVSSGPVVYVWFRNGAIGQVDLRSGRASYLAKAPPPHITLPPRT